MDINNIVEKGLELGNNDDKKHNIYTFSNKIGLSSDLKELLYFDLSFKFKKVDSGINVDYRTLNSFCHFLNDLDIPFSKNFSYLYFMVNFINENKYSNFSIGLIEDMYIGFNVEDEIIYLEIPLIFDSKQKMKLKNTVYTVKNVKIKICKNKIIVNGKKVRNLDKYLLHMYIDLYKNIVKDIIKNDAEFKSVDREYLKETFSSYQSLINIVGH